ncbi:MAG TPA: ATP-binding protein [Terriglobales bacterium]|nr:ATP-binding protein [Terriglobales bacterium]
MKSLFFKIFVFYWLAQALFLILAILVTLAVQQRGEFAAWQGQQSKVFATAVQTYEQGGEEAVRRYLDDVREQLHVRVFLFEEHGTEVTGRPLPRWAEAMKRGQVPGPRDIWQRLTPSPFRHQILTSANGHRYLAFAVLPPGPFGPEGVPSLFLLIGLFSSGLVCYLLAHYLTSPVARLRAATQRLAEGDLSARVGGENSRRNDEIAQLVRDFDGMAGRLEQSVKAQARLLNDVSHELRSPLARLNVALALARQRSGPQAQTALDRIDLEANRLNELIGSLLAIARLENGENSKLDTPVALGPLIEAIAHDADFEAQMRKCRVDAVIVEDCTVMGSDMLLHRALENVVRNAIRYTHEGTSVEVRLEAGEQAGAEQAVVRVSDSGPGVPEDVLDKLFRPFYRVDDARGRQTGGVGLGLAIAERAIRLHGGTVRAKNRPEGGLVVEIRLPRRAPAPLASKLSAFDENAEPAVRAQGD